MKIALKTVLSSLAVGQSLAFTWTRIGCDGDWNVPQGSRPALTVNMNDVWNTALEMTKNAQTSIESTKGLRPIASTARKNAGANSNFIFNVNFSPHKGLDDNEGSMDFVNSIYADIQKSLEETLTMQGVERAYLLCGTRGLTRGRIPGWSENQEVWYAAVNNNGGQPGAPGFTEYIIPRPFRGNTIEPCTEQGIDVYAGKTWLGKAASHQNEDIIGIILCPNQYANHVDANLQPQPLEAYSTLAKDFDAPPRPPNSRAYAAHYNTVAGTLIHEMTHVVGHVRDPPAGYDDVAGGFMGAYDLARGRGVNQFGNPVSALRKLNNPDNYRVFAEMCWSSRTTWGVPEARQ